jgi:hypothetical protein
MVVIEGKELAVLFKYFVQFFDKFKEQVEYLVHVVKFDMMGYFVVMRICFYSCLYTVRLTNYRQDLRIHIFHFFHQTLLNIPFS